MRLFKKVASRPLKDHVWSSKALQRKVKTDLEVDADQDAQPNSESYSVYCWGCGDNGRLGTGDLYSRLEPCLVLHTQCKVKGLACGSLHTILLLEDSKVFAWGEGQNGQLGIESLRESVQPCLVIALSSEQVTDIAAGGLSSAAGLSNKATKSKQAVSSVDSDSTPKTNLPFSLLPPSPPSPPLLTPPHVLLSPVTHGGAVLCWGDNTRGKLGLGAAGKGRDAVYEPAPVTESYDPLERIWLRPAFRRVWVGKRHCAASDGAGGLWTWGDNAKGQLGLGDRCGAQASACAHAQGGAPRAKARGFCGR